MLEHPPIRAARCLLPLLPCSLPEPAQHPSLARGAQHTMVWEVYPAQEIDARGKGRYGHFVRVEFKLEVFERYYDIS